MRRSVVCACLAALGLLVLGVVGATFAARSSRPTGRAAVHATISGRATFEPSAAVGAFGLDLMHAEARGNLVFSPDSIAAALAMAGSGAAGQTATQMAAVLHLKSPHALAAVGQLQETIAGEQAAAGAGHPQAPTLDLANGLFLQQGFPLTPSFLTGLREHFASAAPQSVDFAEPSAVERINAWVNAHTQGVIPQAVAKLSPETVLALADAVYLKAAWLYPFKPSDTSTETFHGEGGAAPTAFMHEIDELRYGHGYGYRAVDVPYRSSTLSLLVVLPVGQSVTTLQSRLAPGRLAQIVRGLATRPVLLALPRFHLSTHIELNGSLQELGMRDAFSPRADFSGITTAEALKIGVVDHAADFTVDEAGTVAAAATIVTAEPTSARVWVPAPIRFDADRPFLFFLRDDHTGAVLFAGRESDPGPA